MHLVERPPCLLPVSPSPGCIRIGVYPADPLCRPPCPCAMQARPQRAAAVSGVAAVTQAVLRDTPMEVDTAPGYSTGGRGRGRWGSGAAAPARGRGRGRGRGRWSSQSQAAPAPSPQQGHAYGQPPAWGAQQQPQYG